MSSNLQTYPDLLGKKQQKILNNEILKNSQFYMHCIHLLHNAAKENCIIDCDVIEDKKLDDIKIAISLATMVSGGECIDEKSVKLKFANAVYAGYFFEITYDEKNITNTDYLNCFDNKNINKVIKLARNKYKCNIAYFLLKMFDLIAGELGKFGYANGINIFLAVEAFFQFGVTLALYKK